MKLRNAFKLFCAIAILVLFAAGIVRYTAVFRLGLPQRRIFVEGRQFSVLIADSSYAREQGLQNIYWMPPWMGMQFVFPKPDKYCFWNKNTLLDLKLLFMRKGKIVERVGLPSIRHGATTVCPKEDVDTIIEINAR